MPLIFVNRVPALLVIINTFRARKESFLEDAWMKGLVESGDTELLVCVLFDDTKNIIVLKEVTKRLVALRYSI
jgi:hypothetical protein